MIRKHLPLIAVAALYWFALAAIPAAYAQTMTPEATPAVVTVTVPGTTVNVEQPPADTTPTDTAQWFDLSKAVPYIAVILILAVLLILEVADRRKLATLAANSMTPEVFGVVSAALNKALADAGMFVAASPSPLDDAVFTPTKAAIADLLARIKLLEDEKASVVVNNNPPPSGSNSG